MESTAAALVIGNELLTGKIDDQNVGHLARRLFALGVRLRRVVVCPDELDVIVADLNALRASHDWVFTSGGVGPTHDDITLDAVAAAFGRPLLRSAEVEAMIRSHYGDRTTEGHLRMANVPEGSLLVRGGKVAWPTVVVDNVVVLPGVPEIFRAKLDVLEDRLRTDAPFHSRAVYTHCDEGDIAALLTRLTHEHPAVLIGSYVKWKGVDYRTKVTFDAREARLAEDAAGALVAALPPDALAHRDE